MSRRERSKGKAASLGGSGTTGAMPVVMRLSFDRGTLLIEGTAPGLKIPSFPGMLWDSRVGAYRCPAHLRADLRNFLAAAGVRFSDETVGELPGARSAEMAMPPLRPYQEAALTAWDLAGRRGLVVLPTGSGKTRLALAAVSRVGEPALCLVPTRVLLEQWVRAIKDVLGCAPGVFGDGEHDLGFVTVATFESAWRHMGRIGNRFGLLIVDEAHHFGNGLRDEALEMCTAPWRLGLTATPPAATTAERLSGLLGATVFELTIGDLVGSFLAPFQNIVIHVSLDAEERAAYDRLTQVFRDVFVRFLRFSPGARWDDFIQAAGRTDEGRRAIAAYHRTRRIVAFPRAKRVVLARLLGVHQQVRTLVFVGDNETAYTVAREHLIMPLTCDIGRKERQRALSLFSEGKLRALVSSQVLNEGLDVPDAEVAIVVAGTRGAREHVQRFGRVLRPRPGKQALVYELVVQGTREMRDAQLRKRALAA